MGNLNALKHGFYSVHQQAQDAALRQAQRATQGRSSDPAVTGIEEAIASLVDKMRHMDHYLQAADGSTSTEGGSQLTNRELIRAFQLYTRASSRLARLLRDRRALHLHRITR